MVRRQVDRMASGGWLAGTWPISHAWHPMAPPPASGFPLAQRRGWVGGTGQGCSCYGGWLGYSSTSSDTWFITSPLPNPTCVSFLSGLCAPWEEGDNPRLGQGQPSSACIEAVGAVAVSCALPAWKRGCLAGRLEIKGHCLWFCDISSWKGQSPIPVP